MTKLLSVRVRPELMAALENRRAELGRNRSQYVLGLIERDLEEARARSGHRFASADLLGAFRTGLPSGDNATVRRVAREKAGADARHR